MLSLYSLYMYFKTTAKLVIGFVVTQMVKENKHNWNDILHYIKFNPHEDSAQLYPHLQGRTSLTLSQAVEVIIACHDSYVAQSVVMHCGGWDAVKMYAQTYFSKIHIQENARDEKNVGELSEVLPILQWLYYSLTFFQYRLLFFLATNRQNHKAS